MKSNKVINRDLQKLGQLLKDHGVDPATADRTIVHNYGPADEYVYGCKQDKLTMLNLQDFRFTKVPSLIQHFPDLKVLYIRDIWIRDIDIHIFTKNTALEKLMLSTDISELRFEIFNPLVNLKLLIIYMNGALSTINPQNFQGLRNLEIFKLVRAPLITDIPDILFESSPNLRQLRIERTGIRSLPEAVFKCKLEKLELINNMNFIADINELYEKFSVNGINRDDISIIIVTDGEPYYSFD